MRFRLSPRSGEILAGLTLIFACGTHPTLAQISYDGFDYTMGESLAGNAGWTAANTGTAPSISAGNLAIEGLLPPTGQQVSFPGGNFQEAEGATTSYTTGDVYFSFGLQLTSLPTSSNYTFGLGSSSTTVGATIWFQASGEGFQIGLSNRSSSSVTFDDTVYSLNAPLFLVGRYSFVTGSSNDISSLWVNPDSSTFAADIAPAASLTALGGTDLSSINRFQLRGANGSAAGLFDELRVGTDWAAVTPIPEPSAYAVLLSTIILGIALFRRRRRQPATLSSDTKVTAPAA